LGDTSPRSCFFLSGFFLDAVLAAMALRLNGLENTTLSFGPKSGFFDDVGERLRARCLLLRRTFCLPSLVLLSLNACQTCPSTQQHTHWGGRPISKRIVHSLFFPRIRRSSETPSFFWPASVVTRPYMARVSSRLYPVTLARFPNREGRVLPFLPGHPSLWLFVLESFPSS